MRSLVTKTINELECAAEIRTYIYLEVVGDKFHDQRELLDTILEFENVSDLLNVITKDAQRFVEDKEIKIGTEGDVSKGIRKLIAEIERYEKNIPT